MDTVVPVASGTDWWVVVLGVAVAAGVGVVVGGCGSLMILDIGPGVSDAAAAVVVAPAAVVVVHTVVAVVVVAVAEEYSALILLYIGSDVSIVVVTVDVVDYRNDGAGLGAPARECERNMRN